MPNITIQIEQPLVNPSPTYPYFRVRYRVKGTSPWTLDPNNRTNAPYVYNFSDTPQIWEMEVSLVLGDGDVCDATIYEIPVKAGCNCLTGISNSTASTHGITYLTIAYTLPSPQPPCGWIIVIKNPTKSDRRLFFATLPASSVTIALTSGDTSFEIFSNCCDEPVPGQIG